MLQHPSDECACLNCVCARLSERYNDIAVLDNAEREMTRERSEAPSLERNVSFVYNAHMKDTPMGVIVEAVGYDERGDFLTPLDRFLESRFNNVR